MSDKVLPNLIKDYLKTIRREIAALEQYNREMDNRQQITDQIISLLRALVNNPADYAILPGLTLRLEWTKNGEIKCFTVLPPTEPMIGVVMDLRHIYEGED